MEESAFEQMAAGLRRRAVDASRACGTDPMAADDIAQDVMLRLWSMRDELDRYSSVGGLAALMAKRLSLNRRRDERMPDTGSDPRQLVSTTAGPQEALEEKENAEWLDRKMAELPTTQHTILYMRQVERRSSKEIAALLGISEASVSTLLARARKALFEEMKLRL